MPTTKEPKLPVNIIKMDKGTLEGHLTHFRHNDDISRRIHMLGSMPGQHGLSPKEFDARASYRGTQSYLHAMDHDRINALPAPTTPNPDSAPSTPSPFYNTQGVKQ